MWVPLLLTAGGYGLHRMRRRARRPGRRVWGPSSAHPGRALPHCTLWAPPQSIADVITGQASPAAQAAIEAVGPVNLRPRVQVAAYDLWTRLLTTDRGTAASMVYAKHVAEKLARGCRLDAHGRGLDVLRSVRDIGIVALAQFGDRNPLGGLG